MHQNPSNTEIEEDNYTQTPLQFSVHEEAVSYFNDVHCLPLPVKTDFFPDQFVSRAVVTHKECWEIEGARNHLLINAPD